MRMLRNVKQATAGVAAALTLALGACSDGGVVDPGPQTPFDAAAAKADVRSIEAAFGTEAFRSFSAAGAGIDAALGSGVGSASAQLLQAGPAFGRQDLRATAERYGTLGGRSGASLGAAAHAPIAPEHFGLTFVLDPATGSYVPLTDAFGQPVVGEVPADVVRFILYRVDYKGAVAIPLVPAGHTDVRQLDEAGTTFQIVVVLGQGDAATTWMDVVYTSTGVFNDGTMSIDGWVASSPENTMEIDIDLAMAPLEFGRQLDFNVDVLVVSSGVRMLVDATIMQTPVGHAGLTVDMTILGQSGSIEVEGGLGGNGAGGEFAVALDGTPIALIGLNGENPGPVITGPEGDAMTAEEQEAMFEVYGVMVEGLGMFFELTAPVSALVFPPLP